MMNSTELLGSLGSTACSLTVPFYQGILTEIYIYPICRYCCNFAAYKWNAQWENCNHLFYRKVPILTEENHS